MRAELTPIDEGRQVNPADMTVRGYIEDEWLPTMRSGKRKATTKALCEMVLTCYVLPRIGDKKMQKLTDRDLSRLYADLRQSGRAIKHNPGGLGEHSVANVRAVLHRFLRDAVRSHLLNRSPADDVSDVPSHEAVTREMVTWTAEEARTFLES